MNTGDIKKLYDGPIQERFGNDYEYSRWFKTPLLHAGYDMTKASIERFIKTHPSLFIKHYLELGPGPGTWTKLFLPRFFGAKFDLVDISSQMLDMCKKALFEYKDVSFTESDFLKFNSGMTYDFFFSSRAVEYFPDKRALVKKIADLLQSGGTGFVITKTPKYFLNKIFKRKLGSMHQGQISPKKFKELLKEQACGNFELYPVTMSFPILKSPKLNKFMYIIFGSLPLNPLSQLFSESYCIKFVKK
jgi:trans-aconitate methyltransferase